MYERLKQKNTTSHNKGVYWDKRGQKFVASIRLNRKLIYLGSYNDEDEAGRKYDEWNIKLFGNYSLTNFQYSSDELLDILLSFEDEESYNFQRYLQLQEQSRVP